LVMELRRSLMFSFFEKYSVTAINLVMTVVVARVLTPDEVGVFMIGNALIMLTAAFRDFGVSAYLIQEREMTPEGVRTAFTATLMLSLLFAGALYALADRIAAFYGEPGLELVLRFAAMGFLLGPFSGPIMALLRREMAFGRIALINIVGAVVSLVTVLVLARLDFGFLSLAWAYLLAGVSTAAMAIRYRPALWTWCPTLVDWRKVLSFGAYSSITVVLNTFYEQLPQLILGRVLSFNAVGLYSRATLLCRLPERALLAAVEPVALPALALEVRRGKDLKEPYLRAIGYMTAVHWPFLICLAFLADPVVRVLLGTQWIEAAPLVRIIALASLSLSPAFMTYPLLVAIGRIKDTLTASLISLPPSVAILSAAAPFGLEVVAASLFVIAPLQVYVALCFIRGQVPFRWSELLEAVRKSALITLLAAIAPATAVVLMGFDLPVLGMVASTVGAAVGWVLGLLLTDHPLRIEAHRAIRAAAACLRRPPFSPLARTHMP
jgi:O-antigen/teichoic acid export membrane protein